MLCVHGTLWYAAAYQSVLTINALKLPDNTLGSIWTVVIDYNDFIIDTARISGIAKTAQNGEYTKARLHEFKPGSRKALINQKYRYANVLPLVVRRHDDRILPCAEGRVHSHGVRGALLATQNQR